MKKILVLALLAIFSVSAFAAKDRVWATGGDKGNYKPMTEEILEVCQGTDPRRGDAVLTTGGSVENVHLATTKKARLFWASIGTIILESENNRKLNEKNWKVVYPMYIEPLNLMIPKGYRPKSNKSGFSAFMESSFDAFDKAVGNKKQPIKIDLNILKGQTIATNSGSEKEIAALIKFTGLKAKLEVMEDSQLQSSGLPVIVVGGAPYKLVEDLLASNKYFLVSIDSKNLSRAASYFEDTSVSYKVGKKYKTIPTIGVRAMLMGKVAKKKHKTSDVKDHGMRALVHCIDENLDDLAEDSDNANWEDVVKHRDSDDIGSWSAFKPYNPEGGSSDDESDEDDD